MVVFSSRNQAKSKLKECQKEIHVLIFLRSSGKKRDTLMAQNKENPSKGFEPLTSKVVIERTFGACMHLSESELYEMPGAD